MLLETTPDRTIRGYFAIFKFMKNNPMIFSFTNMDFDLLIVFFRSLIACQHIKINKHISVVQGGAILLKAREAPDA